jgi:hypothetical protein
MIGRRLVLTVLVALGGLAAGAVPAGAASAPAVDSESSSGATPFAAVLEAQVNPETEDTTCVFEYGPTNAYGTSVPCSPQDLGSGFGDVQATTSLTGLKPNTAYHYRVVVKNATGTTEGEDRQFTTLEAFAPFIDGQSASGPEDPSLTLEAQINPDYQETQYSFQYATDEALTGATNVPGGSIPAGFGDQTASVDLGGSLTPGVYYYRAVAKNAAGTSFGTVQSFARIGPPLAGMGTAEHPTVSTVVLSGTVNPQGVITSYHFEMVSEAGYQAAIAKSAEDPYANGPRTSSTIIAAGYATHATGEVVASELLPDTTYHYALVASNRRGTTIGADATFTTAAATPPIVATGGASNITQNDASITGTLSTQGLPTTYGFELGTEPGVYGPPTGLGSVGASGTEATVTLNLTGLLPGTTYHYRITASNVDGTSHGTDESFTTTTFGNVFVTPPAPLPFVSVPNIAFPTESGTVVVKKTSKKAGKKHKGKRHGKPKKKTRKKK